MKSSPLRAPLLCLGLVALVGCGKGSGKPPQAPPPQVGVIAVQPQDAPLTQSLVGRLAAYRSADVRARVSGVVLKRVYQEGTDVKQGQLLFQIDPAPYQAALDADQAALAQAQATATNARITAQRLRDLRPQGYVSQQDVDNAEANERTGAASVKQAQANVESARINLSYTRVTAPIDGRAGQQQVTEGALVGAGNSDAGASSTLLTTVDQIDPLYVNFTVPVNELEQLRQAQTSGAVTLNDQGKTEVDLSLSDGTPIPQKGTLDFSSVITDASTGAVTLRAILPNPNRSLLPGQYVKLNLSLGQQHNVFLVPQQALQRDPVGAYVFVVGSDGKVARKNVQSDTLRGDAWIVTSGLKGGDQIVVSGVQQVSDGITAKATPWQPNATASTPASPASSGKQQ